MKHLNQQEQTTPKEKETSKCLEAIQALIKTKSYRDLGLEKLNEMDTDDLSSNHLVEYYYLNGRYFFYKFQDKKDLEDLEWANDYFDDLFSIAFKKGVQIEDQRYFYSRAYVKFQLSKLIWDEDRKPWLLKKAKDITDKSLAVNPQNRSFLWLKDQLAA